MAAKLMQRITNCTHSFEGPQHHRENCTCGRWHRSPHHEDARCAASALWRASRGNSTID